MFALLIPPYPLVTPESLTPGQPHPLSYSFQAISPTQIAYAFPGPITSLGVLLLPGQELPPDTAAGIYVHLPSSAAGEFRFLGAIGKGLIAQGKGPMAGEASVNFQVPVENALVRSTAGAGQSQGPGGEVDMDADQGTGPDQASQGMITVGISLEPVANINAQLATLPGEGSVNQLANGASSAAAQPAQLATATPEGQITTKLLAQRIVKNAFNFLASFEGGDGKVPLRSFEDWWKKFERRVEMDAGFLERPDQDG